MTEPAALLTLASTGTVAVAALSAAGLRAWNGWLELRRDQGGTMSARPATGREIAELRARVKHLEAIAEG